LWRECSQRFDPAEHLRHYRQRPVRISASRCAKAVGDFLLHGEREDIDAGDEHLDHQR
jgi:hypothetical protein